MILLDSTSTDICEDVQFKSRIQDLLDEQQTLQRQQKEQNDQRKALQGTSARVSSVTGNLARKRSQNSRRLIKQRYELELG